MARMDELQTQIDAANGWEIERTLQRATDALRCPPGVHRQQMPRHVSNVRTEVTCSYGLQYK